MRWLRFLRPCEGDRTELEEPPTRCAHRRSYLSRGRHVNPLQKSIDAGRSRAVVVAAEAAARNGRTLRAQETFHDWPTAGPTCRRQRPRPATGNQTSGVWRLRGTTDASGNPGQSRFFLNLAADAEPGRSRCSRGPWHSSKNRSRRSGKNLPGLQRSARRVFLELHGRGAVQDCARRQTSSWSSTNAPTRFVRCSWTGAGAAPRSPADVGRTTSGQMGGYAFVVETTRVQRQDVASNGIGHPTPGKQASRHREDPQARDFGHLEVQVCSR
mgnify:CR=1 FL=1